MKAPHWTPEMDERLKQLRIDGLSFRDIGLTMQVTRNAAVGRAKRLRAKGVAIAATVPFSFRVRRAGRGRPPEPKPIRTAAENVGTGLHRATAPQKPWRVVSEAAWIPLDPDAVKPLIGRPPFTCAWPVGGEGSDTVCCGKPAMTGKPYCAYHHALAFIPSKPLTERDIRRHL
jgi:GcrA cell cycle regulator